MVIPVFAAVADGELAFDEVHFEPEEQLDSVPSPSTR
jgi:hypothetical protein